MAHMASERTTLQQVHDLREKEDLIDGTCGNGLQPRGAGVEGWILTEEPNSLV